MAIRGEMNRVALVKKAVNIMENHKRKPVVHADSAHKVEVSNQVKIELIRKFQRIEGNVDCCASAYIRVCKQSDCLWHEVCLAMTQG